jgi:hypothetical protein
MTDTPASEPLLERLRHSKRLRVELLYVVGGLVAGLILVPGLIYVVGIVALGPYTGGPHVGSFYGDFWRHLLAGTLRTWLLALSPLVMLTTGRLIFALRTTKAPPAEPPTETPAQSAAAAKRREPFISA